MFLKARPEFVELAEISTVIGLRYLRSSLKAEGHEVAGGFSFGIAPAMGATLGIVVGGLTSFFHSTAYEEIDSPYGQVYDGSILPFIVMGKRFTGFWGGVVLASGYRFLFPDSYSYLSLDPFISADQLNDRVKILCHYNEKTKKTYLDREEIVSVWLNPSANEKVTGRWGIDPLNAKEKTMGFATLTNPLTLLGECAESLRKSGKTPAQFYPQQIFATANSKYLGGYAGDNYPIYYYRSFQDPHQDEAELITHLIRTEEKKLLRELKAGPKEKAPRAEEIERLRLEFKKYEKQHSHFNF